MPTTRLCECGCGASLDGRRPAARFLDDTHRKRAVRRADSSPSDTGPSSPPAGPPAVELPPGQITRDEAERRRAQAAAEREEMALERERGDWVRAEEVEHQFGRHNVALRDIMLAVSTDAEVHLHPSMSLDEIRGWYAERIREALEAAAAHEEGADDDEDA
jgi:hypothetical protein